MIFCSSRTLGFVAARVHMESWINTSAIAMAWCEPRMTVRLGIPVVLLRQTIVCELTYQPEAIRSGALQPVTKQHGLLLGLPPGYFPMACSKCKVAETFDEAKARCHARKKRGVPQGAFTDVCGLCEVPIRNEEDIGK